MSLIQESLYRFLVHEKLMIIKATTIYIDKKKFEEKKINTAIPTDILYCESDVCKIDLNEKKKIKI